MADDSNNFCSEVSFWSSSGSPTERSDTVRSIFRSKLQGGLCDGKVILPLVVFVREFCINCLSYLSYPPDGIEVCSDGSGRSEGDQPISECALASPLVGSNEQRPHVAYVCV